jgi:hypothetical protein
MLAFIVAKITRFGELFKLGSIKVAIKFRDL